MDNGLAQTLKEHQERAQEKAKLEPAQFKNFRPLGNRLLVWMHAEQDRRHFTSKGELSSGGIWLVPSKMGKRPKWMKATVLAAGPGTHHDNGVFTPMDPELIPGACIMLGYYIGDQVGKEWGFAPDRVRVVSDFQIDAIVDPSLYIEDTLTGSLDKKAHRQLAAKMESMGHASKPLR